MNKLQALTVLRDKVRAGDEVWSDEAAALLGKYEKHWAKVLDAYQGSLDAAKALHEEVLPVGEKGPAVYINNDDWPVSWEVSIYQDAKRAGYGACDTPARAWLLAILGALIAQEENKGD